MGLQINEDGRKVVINTPTLNVNEDGKKVQIHHSILRIHELRRRCKIDENDKMTIKDKIIDVDKKTLAVSIDKWGDLLELDAGWAFQLGRVRDNVVAQIYLDDVAVATRRSHTYIRCFDGSGIVPNVGNPYKLSTDQPTLASSPRFDGDVVDLEDDRLCAVFSDASSATPGLKAQVLNIVGLDVDSAGTAQILIWTGQERNPRMAKDRPNQCVVVYHDGNTFDNLSAIAFTLDGDNVDSYGSAVVIADNVFRSDRFDIVSSATGKATVLHQYSHVTDPSTNLTKLNVAVDNTITIDYVGGFNTPGQYNWTFGNLEYSSFLDMYLLSGSKITEPIYVKTAIDTGSGFTFSAETNKTQSGSMPIYCFFDGSRGWGVWRDDQDSEKLKIDSITFTGTVPAFDNNIVVAESTGSPTFYDMKGVLLANGNIFYSWGKSDTGGTQDKNYARIWVR